MASLHFPAPASHPARALRRLSAGTQATPSFDGFIPGHCTSIAHVNIRFKNEAIIKVKERWWPIFASNANLPEESDNVKTSDTARRPPFLTILAGFVVFFGICWIIGSIVMWLVGFIVHPPH